jgi:tetratricopeptide (TPR) repeat protein
MNPVDPKEASQTEIPEQPETPVEPLWQRWRQEQCPDFSDPAAGGLSAEQALAVLRYDQCRRWQAGERVPAEKYLQTYSILKTDPDQALVLIYGEFVLRQQLGESPTLDEYLQRFPDWAERLRQQDEFHRAVEGVSWLDPGDTALPEQAGVCRVVGEIARGGMGMILKGHDQRLGRDLAVKVLRDEYKDRPEVVRRFLEEAQVSGQLQHPGIVPVHEVGQFDDGRPYFTMKLVQGQTLGKLLSERKAPDEDLPRFLKIFEQMCQTLAYAHSKGVIHRDLKPANVMVGAFGEVQVMDWGLAKQKDKETRRQGDKEREDRLTETSPVSLSPCLPVSMSDEKGQTQPGQAVGTPAYMAPEQARGEGSILDERCDVFGLGAVLCEILTGQPPYVGQRSLEILDQAKRYDLDGALARLDGCGADAELLQLAKACLAPAPQDRPRDAGAVADRMTAYLAGVQERLRRAEVERAAAQARAAAERRARRLTLGLAAAGLALLLLASGAGAWVFQKQTETAAAVQAALEKAWQFKAEGKPAEAEASARDAETLLEGSWGHADLRQRIREVRADIEAETTATVQAALNKAGLLLTEGRRLEAEAAAQHAEDLLAGSSRHAELRRRVGEVRADIAMGGALEEIHLQTSELTKEGQPPDPRRMNRAYAEAFQKYGLPVDNLTAQEAAARIRQRAIALPLALALDYWALHRRKCPEGEAAAWRHLFEVAQLADPDEWRNRFRAVLAAEDHKALPVLAAEAKGRMLPAPSWLLLATAARQTGGVRAAVALLQVAEQQHPSDFWIHMELADDLFMLITPPQYDAAIRHYTACRTLRPGNAVMLNNFGAALMNSGRLDPAIPILKEAVRLRPDYAIAHGSLSGALQRKGDLKEALAAADEAIRLDPDLTVAHFNRGLILKDGDPKQYPEALASFDRALKLRPDYPEAQVGRGSVFRKQGELDKALTAYDRAIKLKPDLAAAHEGRFDTLFGLARYPEALAAADRALQLLPNNGAAHGNRSRALALLGRFADALTAVDRAIQLLPNNAEDSATAHHLRGQVLKQLNRHAEAADAFRKAILIKEDFAAAYFDLGVVLQGLGQLGKALTALDRAIALKPDWPEVHHARGQVFVTLSRFDEAAKAFREATRCKENFAEAYCGLGQTLQETGRFVEALEALKRGHELGSRQPGWSSPSKQWVRDCEHLIEVDKKLPALLRGEVKPASADEATWCARLCHYRARYESEVRFYEDAFAANPKLAEDLNAGYRYNAACAAALIGCGRGKDDPPLDEPARANRRTQALGWLRADMALLTKQLESNTPQGRAAVQQRLLHWQHDPDLAGLRDKDGLANLPEAEREACRRLWADVEALRKRLSGPK